MAPKEYLATTEHTLVNNYECASDAMVSTFAAMFGEEPIYESNIRDETSEQRIVAVLSLVGDVSWTMLLRLPRETALNLAPQFAGFDVPFESADMGDVVGELINIFAGNVVARLDERGIKTEMSLPTIIRGACIDTMLPERAAVMHMRFDYSEGVFWLQLASPGEK